MAGPILTSYRILGLDADSMPALHYLLLVVIAVGSQDNPAADIQGANAANGHVTRWVSILVRSGIFPAHLPNDPHHPAHHVVHDVTQAFQLIAQLEGCTALC